MALLQQGRPRDAAALLTGGARRRTQDGLSPTVDRMGFGLMFSPSDGGAIQLSLMSGFPGSHPGLVLGDILLKVNDTD